MQNSKESIIRTKEFLELWKKFDQIYKEAMGKASITEEEEELFLETKSIVARKFQILVDSLPVDRPTIDRTFDVINQTISLKSISTFSEEALKRISNDWHQTYISLNRLLGHLEVQKDSDVHDGAVAIKKRYISIARSIAYILIIFIVIAIIFFLAHILGIFSINR